MCASGWGMLSKRCIYAVVTLIYSCSPLYIINLSFCLGLRDFGDGLQYGVSAHRYRKEEKICRHLDVVDSFRGVAL
jgi:hypothetical protein